MVDSSIKLVFPNGFTDRDEFEARARGFLSHVWVEIDGQNCYPIVFYDPVRLKQDLEALPDTRSRLIAYPGMIVLDDITLQAMQDAVLVLYKEGYFRYLVPLSREQITKSTAYHWPPEI